MPVDFLTACTCRLNVEPNSACFVSHKKRQRDSVVHLGSRAERGAGSELRGRGAITN